jgi:hypothetical protein
MMASEFAESICTAYFNNSEGALLRNVVDAELQEVRECLDECIAAFPKTAEGEQRAKAAQRARQLAERLRVG